MGKKWLFLSLIFVLASCADPLDITYELQASIEGDLYTDFPSTGGTRSLTVSFMKEKRVNGHYTGQYFTVPASRLRIEVKDGPFQLTNQQVTDQDKVSFDLSVPESEYEYNRSSRIACYIDDGGEVSSYIWDIWQDKADILREYRIISDANPFVVPVEGGEFTVGFTVESRRIVDGFPEEWACTYLGGLRYNHVCLSAASHHSVRVTNTEVGHYTFHINAQPYYLDPEVPKMKWGYYIYMDGVAIDLKQEFLHEEDPSVAETESPATGNTNTYGFLHSPN